MPALKPPVKPAVAVAATVESIPLTDLDDPSLVLSVRDLHEISKLVGLNILTAPQLIERVRLMSTLSVADVQVVLEPGLLTRLKSRCLRANWSEWLPAEVKRQLHAYVGWMV